MQTPELPFSVDVLFRNMMENIQQTEASTDTAPITRIEICIGIVKEAMEQLRDFVSRHPFPDEAHEIEFFKKTKPQFYSRLIYYLKIYQLELNRPPGSNEEQEKYFSKELHKLKSYFENHREFYHYYRSGATHLDRIYFLSHQIPLGFTLNPVFMFADKQFSTAFDYKLSKILANDMLQLYLSSNLAKCRSQETHGCLSNRKTIKWTAPKAALVEIIYSFQSYGVFNNGAADVKEIASYLQEVFHVELGNYYNCFQEIRLRKKCRTIFLNQLTEKLSQRMDEADEN